VLNGNLLGRLRGRFVGGALFLTVALCVAPGGVRNSKRFLSPSSHLGGGGKLIGVDGMGKMGEWRMGNRKGGTRKGHGERKWFGGQ